MIQKLQPTHGKTKPIKDGHCTLQTKLMNSELVKIARTTRVVIHIARVTDEGIVGPHDLYIKQ